MKIGERQVQESSQICTLAPWPCDSLQDVNPCACITILTVQRCVPIVGPRLPKGAPDVLARMAQRLVSEENGIYELSDDRKVAEVITSSWASSTPSFPTTDLSLKGIGCRGRQWHISIGGSLCPPPRGRTALCRTLGARGRGRAM